MRNCVGKWNRAFVLAALAIICCVDGIRAQKSNVDPTDGMSKSEIAINDLITQARMSSPELGADALLRIAKSGRIRNLNRRVELLEEVYRLSDNTRNRVPMVAVPIEGVSVDTQYGYLSSAYKLKLDGLSLKSRILREMVNIDKARARQIASDLNGKLELEPLKCEAALVYDVPDIYAAVAVVAKAAFTKKQVEDGSRAMFIASWFENIESPSQIGPALDLLAGFQESRLERQIITNAISRAISKNFNDDRSFTYAVDRERIGSKVYRLTTGIDDPIKSELRSAYREFLIKNLRTSRCKDNEIANEDRIPIFVKEANRMFADKPLTFENIVHTDLSEGPAIVHYWQSGDSRRLSRALRELYKSEDGSAITKENKANPEWQSKVRTFLENLDSWTAQDSETESGVFNQKCVLYRSVVKMVPEGGIRKSVVRSYLRFLSRAPMQEENFIEWFLHVSHLAAEEPELFNELSGESPNPHFRLMNDLRAAGI